MIHGEALPRSPLRLLPALNADSPLHPSSRDSSRRVGWRFVSLGMSRYAASRLAFLPPPSFLPSFPPSFLRSFLPSLHTTDRAALFFALRLRARGRNWCERLAHRPGEWDALDAWIGVSIA